VSDVATIAPVRKSVTVACSLERAWRVFAEEPGSWWRLSTHSVHEEKAKELVLEPREGGEMYEIAEGGERAHWARVTVWEPPKRLVLAWHVNPEAPADTEIEVTFTREGEGTRVDLEHRGWELLGAEGRDRRDQYDGGWDPLLELYAAKASA
jgi:uncharacterized protein YndB with AHSA1/START domain